jgi:TPR repeat protein
MLFLMIKALLVTCLMLGSSFLQAAAETSCEKTWNDYYDHLPDSERDPNDALIKFTLIDDCKNDYKLMSARYKEMNAYRMRHTLAIENFKKGFDAYQLKDYTGALKGFLLAAKAGDHTSQYNLAVMHAKGEGTPQNHITAYMWIDTAVSNGDENGRGLRDALLEAMTVEQIRTAQALARECAEEIYVYADVISSKTRIKDSCLK